MSEDYLRQSALSHLSLATQAAADAADAEKAAAAGLRLAEKPFRTMVTLRGDAADAAFVDAVKDVCGLAPVVAANEFTVDKSGDRAMLWMGPDEWLVIAEPDVRPTLPDAFSQAFDAAGLHAAAVEVGEYYEILSVAGERARDVLAKGCTIDLHPASLPAGRCAQTLLAKANVTLIAHKAGIDLIVRRSFADYLWHWLEDAGVEYGCVTVMVD